MNKVDMLSIKLLNFSGYQLILFGLLNPVSNLF